MEIDVDMMLAALRAELRTLLDVPAAQLADDARLEGFANWDSLSKVSLVAFACDRYQATLSSDELDSVPTVGALGELLLAKLQVAAA